VCFDVCDQGRELIAIAPTRENDEAFSGEFSRDRRPDVVAGSDHRDSGISHLHDGLVLGC
jgi:hypothetical protein